MRVNWLECFDSCTAFVGLSPQNMAEKLEGGLEEYHFCYAPKNDILKFSWQDLGALTCGRFQACLN